MSERVRVRRADLAVHETRHNRKREVGLDPSDIEAAILVHVPRGPRGIAGGDERGLVGTAGTIVQRSLAEVRPDEQLGWLATLIRAERISEPVPVREITKP